MVKTLAPSLWSRSSLLCREASPVKASFPGWSGGTQGQGSRQSAPVKYAMTTCRRQKSYDATFFEDLEIHIDEFIHASNDEHKTCFQKTIQKMFGMSKVVAERSAEAREVEVESVLPLQTII